VLAEADDALIETSDVIPMFPTLVWKVQLKARVHEPMDAKILATLERMRRDGPELACGQGRQSPHTLHELEEFRDLVAYVNKAVTSVLRFL